MGASWKHVESESDIDQLSVRLRPLLGISPVVYVPLAWGVLIATLVFLVLVYPGLRNPGSLATITSSPEGAAVYIDGTRVGATPATVFVDAGERRVETGFGENRETTSLDVGRRIVGSLLFPKRIAVHHVHGSEDAAGLVAAAVTDFAAWSLNGEPSGQFQQPPIAHDVARRLWATGSLPLSAVDTLRGSLVAQASPSQARDVAAALVRTGAIGRPATDPASGVERERSGATDGTSIGTGAAVTPAAIADAVRFFVRLDNSSPFAYRAAGDLVPGDTPAGTALQRSEWLAARVDSLSTTLLAGSLAPDERSMPENSRRSIAVGSEELVLMSVPSGRYSMGYPLRDSAARGVPLVFEDPYWIQDQEVDGAMFRAFLEARPEWGPGARDDLLASGLVTGDYLAGISDDNAAMLPARHVSWYAAEAFVDWLNDTVSQDVRDAILDGGRFALPSAAQWEYAAFLNGLGAATVVAEADRPVAAGDSNPGALGVHHLAGNVWEWTADWYAPRGEIVSPVSGDQRVVYGGSFASGNAGHNLVGAQPPAWATPYLGFRVVLVGSDRGIRNDER